MPTKVDGPSSAGTAAARLPDFLILGAAKAGTTSLYRYLDEHPQVFMSPVKETNYFASAEEAGWRPRIASSSAYRALFSGVRNELAVGEASPLYLASRTAPERIREELGDVRLIASLRDPAERAWSGYWMQVRKGREKRSPESCFQRGDLYVEGGFYADDLERYLRRFDRRRLHVCLFEDLADDPLAVMRRIFEFLGVDPGFHPDTTVRHNVGGAPRRRWIASLLSRPWLTRSVIRLAPAALRRVGRRLRRANLRPPPPMPEEVRHRLGELYRDDVVRLESILGRDLSSWLDRGPQPEAQGQS